LLIEQSEYYTEIAAGFLCKRTEPCSGTFLGYFGSKGLDVILLECFRFGMFFFAEITTQLHQFGCFLKWWYPQTIGFSIIFTIHFGVFPYFWKHPFVNGKTQISGSANGEVRL